ncbi:MAG: hypothetical protein LBJ61_01430 [Deltaproteobacteria bacterium]|jgi:hypothetical protein|nr:hypothetical protein [Deltaproteobacteria bacterium]
MFKDNLTELFGRLLSITEHLYIKDVSDNEKEHEVHIRIDFDRATKFTCPLCGKENNCIHDRLERT